MHIPVLLQEVVQILGLKNGDFVIDGTIDGGGHAAAMLKNIGPKGNLLGVDLDAAMITRATARFSRDKNVALVAGNYADLPKILESRRMERAHALLLDLGFSSEQLAHSGRGFSFSADEPLLMTYDDGQTPVRDILRQAGEKQLADIIFTLGGERLSRRIAQAIKMRERAKPIRTSRELAEVVRGAVPKHYERGRMDPATRTFQALRIYANDELGNLDRLLHALPEVVRQGGRVAVISFHSLEDKLVKDNFRTMARSGEIELLTKKPVVPSREEQAANPRSRSAKLRAAIMI
ncbi:MAG: 16S rRNA (cytosine(1402)-N(4))-methyltransferase [Candidatus Liptonbacteria bacterium RIFCSPLOWO2_01_FULL_56_20]|uniref:Ribosomal RNA small subunit methyltransferase H n=1 Tax=Candidatus Liptonbacteria bacterium RIFCSPLOWO2_01_FULL_56_20 TaxID=1798652 RepID=A0A1G2CHP7_9BACT|nr:MAG: 16S rRNA (cytosine(1402)-N(4))-methyltransferase [Candidatus Liptonbacteria bacterium RIFCSPHIGHO2_01_FULL_56_18b]OGZ00916.1 MAG: 16S rRNA (cytosine(1402)-N(4))-methyltransferase [Candidatus Liptonbacteria bacterium RIFCSPLOWO2_01_FULL_56_20]